MKRKTGPKPHDPTQRDRELVMNLVGFGLTQPQICDMMGFKSAAILRKHYRRELDVGEAALVHDVARSLKQKAMGNDSGSVAAATFLLSRRGGDAWKEHSTMDHTNRDRSLRPVTINLIAPAPAGTPARKPGRPVLEKGGEAITIDVTPHPPKLITGE